MREMNPPQTSARLSARPEAETLALQMCSTMKESQGLINGTKITRLIEKHRKIEDWNEGFKSTRNQDIVTTGQQGGLLCRGVASDSSLWDTCHQTSPAFHRCWGNLTLPLPCSPLHNVGLTGCLLRFGTRTAAPHRKIKSVHVTLSDTEGGLFSRSNTLEVKQNGPSAVVLPKSARSYSSSQTG